MKDYLRKKTKKLLIICSILFIFVQMVPVALADGIIIDHTCTDLSQIPDSWLEQAKNLTLHYAHTSHGSQITSGILNLETLYSKYSVAIRRDALTAGLPSQENPPALRIYDGNPLETYISPNDYWYGDSGKNRTRAVANTGDYNFSMWSWCGQVSGASQSYMQNYLDTMAQFEVEYPNMRFIYMTGHLDGSGSSGNLHVRNEQIRAYCNANNKVLFDFADIERYNPDGTDYLDLGANDNCDYSGGNWATEWCAANPGSDLCDSCSCSHSQSLNCNVKAKAFWWMMARLAGWNPDGEPVADFSGTPTTGTLPLVVSFTDTSTGETTGWSWDFDNNETVDSTDQNPTHTYNDAGTYSVALEVTGQGGTDTETKTNYITVTEEPIPPVADFSGTPATGTASLVVSFTDTSTGAITERSWDFGDTSLNNNEQNPIHTYDAPGIYTVSLTVTGQGGTDTETKTNYITVTEEPIPPVADFSGTPTTGTLPLVVSFTDTSTGETTGWSWDFDNNETVDSTDQNPTHTYNDAGTYSVALEVTGQGGTDTETKTNYITVTTTPIQYNLTVNTVGSGSVTLVPAGSIYDPGTEVQLTPVPDTGWIFNSWSGDLSGYSNPDTVVMNSDKTITATFDLDDDADGISDAEEDAGPNGGDGNDDNQQDSDQANVTTFHTQDGTNYVTLESVAGTTLADCSAVSVPSESGAPSGVTFPYGFIEFTINGAGTGDATTLILYLPAEANINTYWKYGPTPTNANPHWYEFMYESSTQTGAVINGNKVTLHFVDGKRGDDDITDDGIIIDQGGAGTFSSSSGGGSSDDGGGGGGCFVGAAYGK